MGWSSKYDHNYYLLPMPSLDGAEASRAHPTFWTDGIHGGGYVDAWMDDIFFCSVGVGMDTFRVKPIGHNPKFTTRNWALFTVFQSSIAAMSFKDATNWFKKEHPEWTGILQMDLHLLKDTLSNPLFVFDWVSVSKLVMGDSQNILGNNSCC